MHLTRKIFIVILSLFISPISADDSRLQFLNKLLNTSSGANQVLNSNNPEALELRQKALALFEQAQQSSNPENVPGLLDQSAKHMFQAIKLATPTSLTNSKITSDFNKRKQSIETLTDAFNRIADETENCNCKEKTNDQISSITAQAETLINNGQPGQARIKLDKAYQLLKVSIESLRGGQTLVRSLKFSSPEEEYHYEIDRNDTHNMLVNLLTSDKKVSDYTSQKISEFTDKANSLRNQAEKSAASNQFESAIDFLEQSTKELVRAIRSAGIYIPG